MSYQAHQVILRCMLKVENHWFRCRHMKIMGKKNSNSFTKFSLEKPKYQVQVKCQWFYLKISISIFSNWLSFLFLNWQAPSNQNVKWEHMLMSSQPKNTHSASSRPVLVSKHLKSYKDFVPHTTPREGTMSLSPTESKDWSLLSNMMFESWV